MTYSERCNQDKRWMNIALEEASQAAVENEVPIGAVLVLNGELVSRDHNRTIQNNDPTAHAEILVMRSAAQELQNYRLLETVLYVTVEPCAMCAGALIWARVSRLVYGAQDKKGGGIVSKAQLLTPGLFNHSIEITGDICTERCRSILQEFFSSKRG